MSKFVEYIKETQGEMKHVSWPTRSQAIGYTVAVVLISVITSLYLGLFDGIFAGLLNKLIAQ
jgi:preprotein translocase SecE subunit